MDPTPSPIAPVDIRTERLLLRPLVEADAPVLSALAADPRISETTLTVPRPYTLDDARSFIERTRTTRQRGESQGFGVFERRDEPVGAAGASAGEAPLVGTCGLSIDSRDRRAELGFWIGVPYWGRGYATEAAGAVIDYGFRELGLERIHAGHFAGNEASRRVQEKLGLAREGVLRRHHIRFGERRDLVVWAALRQEWLARHAVPLAAWAPAATLSGPQPQEDPP